MDPDANIREQIQLRRAKSARGHWAGGERARTLELTRAYREWRGMGGFPASVELLAELDGLRWPRQAKRHVVKGGED